MCPALSLSRKHYTKCCIGVKHGQEAAPFDSNRFRSMYGGNISKYLYLCIVMLENRLSGKVFEIFEVIVKAASLYKEERIVCV